MHVTPAASGSSAGGPEPDPGTERATEPVAKAVDLAAQRLPGEPVARCVNCAVLLVELAVPLRLTVVTGNRSGFTVTLTHAHSSSPVCARCVDWDSDAPPPCHGDHDAEPCGSPEPVCCIRGGCDNPALIHDDHCRTCAPDPDARHDAWR